MENKKNALCTGANGQMCSLIIEFLLDKGYQVIGTIRRTATPNLSNMDQFINNPNFTLEEMDLACSGSINRVISQYKPQECYNIAGQSFVHASWKQPLSTFDINCNGVIRLLEAIRLFSPETKFYQSSSSEVYGDTKSRFQNEFTEISPRSPYGASKAAGEQTVKVWKESYNLFACYARNFNMESNRRGLEFVTRKITYNVARIITQSQVLGIPPIDAIASERVDPIFLGSLSSQRDWSNVRNHIEGAWLMLQKDTPDNYVFASGETHSIKDFLDESFGAVGIYDWSQFVKYDVNMVRPAEVNYLRGDSTKAAMELGWVPKINFRDLVQEMISSDLKLWASKLGIVKNTAIYA